MLLARDDRWSAPGSGFSSTRSRRTWCWATCPTPFFFAPGPAYNPVGPAQDQIIPAVITGTLDPGVPVYDTPSCASFECDVFSFDRNIKTPYMENYNINFQQQLSSRMVVQVGYVGSQGHRLWRFFDLNQPSAATINACDLGLLDPARVRGRRDPGLWQRGTSLRRLWNGKSLRLLLRAAGKLERQSNYNSIQTSLRISNWHGVTSIMNYVWSKSLDNSSDGEDFEPNAAQPQDSTSPQREYGPSNFHVPHRFSWIFAYDLPTMGGSWRRLKNGWGLSSHSPCRAANPTSSTTTVRTTSAAAASAMTVPTWSARSSRTTAIRSISSP